MMCFTCCQRNVGRQMEGEENWSGGSCRRLGLRLIAGLLGEEVGGLR